MLSIKFHVNQTLFALVTGYYLLQGMRGEMAAGWRHSSPNELQQQPAAGLPGSPASPAPHHRAPPFLSTSFFENGQHLQTPDLLNIVSLPPQPS